jgi:hypothetical protein
MPDNNQPVPDNGDSNDGSSTDSSIVKDPQMVLMAAAAGGLIGGLVGALIGNVVG